MSKRQCTGAPPTDLTLKLPNGETVDTFASIVSAGSQVLETACSLRSPGEVIDIAIDVSAAGLKRALDDLLPAYLKSERIHPPFNPFVKSHRDYIECLRYLCVPDYENTLSELSKENVLFSQGGATSDTTNACEALAFLEGHSAVLSSEVEAAMSRVFFDIALQHSLKEYREIASDRSFEGILVKLASDENGKHLVERLGGRAFVSHLGKKQNTKSRR